MSDKERIPLADARRIAIAVLAELQPYCERIEIAGSIRRARDMIGDVEILCIPKPTAHNLFGEPLSDAVTDYLSKLPPGWAKRLSKAATPTFGKYNKLMLYRYPELFITFPVDIFSTTHENWGMALLIRTGPYEFNKAVMIRFRELGMRGHAYGGVTDAHGNEIPCPDEETVFRLLQWEYVPPEKRDEFAQKAVSLRR
jgi:DNA polymerase/3'-5' exonuclease PolX